MAEIVGVRKYQFRPPDGLNIYRLRRPAVSEEIVRRLGDRFGLPGTVDAGTFIHNGRGIAYADRSGWGLRLFGRSGGWQYRHATRWQADDGAGHLRIDDDDAARLALDAVTRYDVAAERQLQLAHVQRLHVAHAERDGANHSDRIAGVRVVFGRIVDDLPAEGPGGKSVVYFDHERQLTGIDHLWHEIEDVYEPVAGLRPVGDVLEEVRRRYEESDGIVEVSDIRLGYYELGWDGGQEFLQPAYVVFLQLRSPDEHFRINATVALPAAVNAPGPVEPELRPSEPQASRAR
jgi:hypothetical protein